VPWARVRKDEDNNVCGILGEAFCLRPGEEYLSVTWCEYFDGDNLCQLKCAVEAIRKSKLEVRPKGRFAVASVGLVDSFLTEARHHVRFIHESEQDNPAHTALRRWPVDEVELMERLALDLWSTSYSKDDIDALRMSECSPSARGLADTLEIE
jgi:hypothetical protein